MSECTSFGFLGPTAPPSKESMELLNAIALFTGWMVWIGILLLLFFWSIGRFSIVSVKVTEEKDVGSDR